MMEKTPVHQLTVIVNSPDKLLWEGRAQSVSSENSAGAFDVLPEHANFITMVENKPVIVRQGNSERRFDCGNAVLTAKDNTVTVYAEI